MVFVRLFVGLILMAASYALAGAAVDYSLVPTPVLVAWCGLFAIVSAVGGAATLVHVLLEINEIKA